MELRGPQGKNEQITFYQGLGCGREISLLKITNEMGKLKHPHSSTNVDDFNIAYPLHLRVG